jgi:hypothetical protein
MRPYVLVASAVLFAAALHASPAPAQDAAPDSAAADSTAAYAPPPAETPAAAPPGSASIANPATSVIGWFQAAAGNDRRTQENAFDLREAEVALQAAVDPYAKADFILSFSPETGVDVEEAYLTWLSLPLGGQAKIGKFRADFGKFNRTHAGETPFADRPLSTLAFGGEEGLATTGLSLTAMLPTSFYWDVTGNVGTAPAPGENTVWAAYEGTDLLWLGRTSAFLDLSEASNLNLGVSYAQAPSDSSLIAEGDHAALAGADVTFRWKNPRRSIYRSLTVQSEFTREQGSASGAPSRSGWFGYALYQFARRWKLGARYDSTERTTTPEREHGLLGLLQFQPSEFSVISLQARRIHDDYTDTDGDAVFLKWTFNIGPHGAHPY